MKDYHTIPLPAAALFTETGFTDASFGVPKDPFSFSILSKTVAESKTNKLFNIQQYLTSAYCVRT